MSTEDGEGLVGAALSDQELARLLAGFDGVHGAYVVDFGWTPVSYRADRAQHVPDVRSLNLTDLLTESPHRARVQAAQCPSEGSLGQVGALVMRHAQAFCC
ncbi:hypothetical protein [Streptomyces sp. NPDC060035]|uniref:hypothetical protein n=1 Tax=Streptomyces sp. NPDC060035 TaxID=3347044 RepID=UPI0036C9B1DC